MFDFFLVLGQIPGTNIQLTFNELAAFIDIALFIIIFRKKITNIHLIKRLGYFIHNWRLIVFIRKGTQLKLSI